MAYTWQLAIACVALCVRVSLCNHEQPLTHILRQMQRDFLLPLHPVTNKELILLAPQDMTVHDLEVNPLGTHATGTLS